MSEALDRIKHFYYQTDGTYKFPNSAEGDLLKICLAEIESLTRENKILTIKNRGFEQAFTFCPDCRDKVKNEPCQRCEKQRWQAKYETLKNSINT